MKKLFTILFLSLCATTYSQTFYYPVVIKQTMRVDGKVAIGGVTFDRDFTVTADTIRIKNLDGTGTILGIDVNGDVTRVTGIGAAGVTGLNDYEPLFGSLTGTIEQDNFWYYDPTTQFMRLGDPAGTAGGEIYVVNGTTGSNMTPTSVGVTGSVGQTYMDGQYFNLYDLDGEFFSIGRATWSADEVLLFPAAKGALNQSLYVSNVSGDNVTFSWYTPASGTVTSVATTTPITGGTITSTGTIGIGGLSTFGTAGQLIRTNAGGTGWEYFTPTYGTGTVTSIATTSPIGGGTITSTGTLNLLASGADKMLLSSGVNTWIEVDVTPFSVSLFDNTEATAYLVDLSIPTNPNEILFGTGTGLTTNSSFSFNTGTELFDIHRMDIDGSTGNITQYENNAASDGQLFIGETSSGAWKTGTITATDITVGYSSPNITLDIASGAIVNADINASAAIDATKIGGGGVTTTEFDYLGGVTSDVQTQLDSKTVKVGTAVNLTGQNAPIGITTIYTTPATDGFYQVNWVASITTAGTTSILGPFRISFTNASDNVVKTYPTSAVSFYNQTNANTTGASIGGSFTVYCKASTDIRYIMGRTSTGTAMVYDLNIQIVKL